MVLSIVEMQKQLSELSKIVKIVKKNVKIVKNCKIGSQLSGEAPPPAPCR